MERRANAPVPSGRAKRRSATEAKLKAAVGKIVRRLGAEKLGVNAVAAEAGVDKVLIYRYFGDLEGLLRAYGESADFWPSVDELLGPEEAVLREPDLGALAAALFRNYVKALRSRPVTLELLAWECLERGPLTAVLEEVREQRSLEVFQRIALAGFAAPEGVRELSAIVGAGLNYLCVRARHVRVFGGVPLDDETGWDAIVDSVGQAFGALAGAPGGKGARLTRKRQAKPPARPPRSSE